MPTDPREKAVYPHRERPKPVQRLATALDRRPPEPDSDDAGSNVRAYLDEYRAIRGGIGANPLAESPAETSTVHRGVSVQEIRAGREAEAFRRWSEAQKVRRRLANGSAAASSKPRTTTDREGEP